MTEKEAQDIIESTLKSHWPNWEFKGQEFVVWVEELRKFDFETAKTSINELYKGWKGERYPKMAHIMAAIRDYARSRFRQGKVVKLYAIFCADGKLRWKPFWGNGQRPREEIEIRAGQKLARANDIETGHFIQYYNVNDDVDTGYYGDPKLSIPERRAQARDKAFADILNGPDDKTRRWLVSYLERKYPEKCGDVDDMMVGLIDRRV